MNNNNHRVSLAAEIAKKWNEASVPYAVVHGVENYPQKIGRDIDLVMSKEKIAEALEYAMEVGLSHCFSRGYFRWSHWGLYQLVLLHDESETSLPIDIICTTMNWNAKWISLIDEDQLNRFIESDSQIGHFQISEEGAFYKSCVKPFLCGDLSRFDKEIKLPTRIPKTVSHEHLKETVGSFGLSLLESSNITVLKKAFPQALKKLQLQWVLSHPIKAIHNLWGALHRRVMIYFSNSSNIVQLHTTDPESLEQCLQKLVQPLKHLFIELRPVSEKYGSLKTIWASLIGLRHRPISEFILYTIIKNTPETQMAGASSKVSLRLGRGRVGLGPDAIITIPPGIEDEDLYYQLRDQFISLLETFYPLPKYATGLVKKGER